MILGKLSGLCTAILTLAACTSQQSPSPTPTLVIAHVNVVDVANARILPDSTVAISGNVITSITPDAAVAADTHVVDANNGYLIPGLWDMHAHTETSGESSLQLYVANGVTGIRDMGSELELILRLREATTSGNILGPRIFAAGPILDDAPGDWPYRMRVRTAEEGRAAVRLLAESGVDLIKVHDNTPREVYFAIAEEASRQGLPLAGHIPRGITAEEAIDAGQQDIEHLSNMRLWRPCSGGTEYRAEACQSFFTMLAQRGIWQTPTLAAWAEVATIGTPASALAADQLVYVERSLKESWAGNQATFDAAAAAPFLRAAATEAATVVNDMERLGIGILAGCDATIPGFCIHDELDAMVHGGMTPAVALQTATLNPARYFGLEDTAGSISTGQRADLVLLDANPLDDIANTRRIRAVILAGRLLDRQKLDEILQGVKSIVAQ